MKHLKLMLTFVMILLVPLAYADNVTHNNDNSCLLADAQTKRDVSSTNYGSDVTINHRRFVDANGKVSYMMFCNDIPTGSVINNATLSWESFLFEVSTGSPQIHDVYMNDTHIWEESIITYDNAPCTDGSGPFGNTTKCNASETLTASTGAGNKSIEVTHLVQRAVDQDQMNISFALTSNGASGVESIIHSKEAGATNNEPSLFIDYTPPAISLEINVTIIKPEENGVYNTPVLNLFQINNTFGLPSDTGVISNVTIFINGTINTTFFSDLNKTIEISDGVYNLTVVAYDNESNTGTSDVLKFIIDDTAPEITINSPPYGEILHNQIYNLTILSSCTDSGLLNRFNVTGSLIGGADVFSIENATANTTDTNLIELNRVIGLGNFTDGDYNLSFICADSHTSQLINPYVVLNRNNEIIFRKGMESVSITPQGDYGNMITRKMKDRYQFGNPDMRRIGTYAYTVSSNLNIRIIEGSQYKGHLVTGSRWIDFENPDVNSRVIINRINRNKVEVIVTGSSIMFNSIGDLNVIQEETMFTVESTQMSVEWITANNTLFGLDDLIFDDPDYSIETLALNITTPTNITADCGLYLNDSLLYNVTEVLSVAPDDVAVFGLEANYNETFFYHADIKCTSVLGESNSRLGFSTLLVEPTPPVAPEDVSYNQCVFTDASTGTYVFILFLFVLSLVVMVSGFIIKNGIVGFLGTIVLFVSSLFLWYCSSMVALIMTLLSFWLGWMFMSKGIKGTL